VLRIGEFSRLAQVTVKTLHHYDDIGLLQPARTDADTNYRYYTLEQLPRLHRIMVLRELGLSLDQIAGVLDRDPSTEALRGMLVLKRAEVEGRLAEELARLTRVEFHLGQIDFAPEVEQLDVRVRRVEPIRRALALRRTFPSWDAFYRAGMEVNRAFETLQVPLVEPVVTVSHAEEFRTTEVEVEFVMPVADSYDGGDLALPSAGTLALQSYPGIARAATYVVEGVPTDESTPVTRSPLDSMVALQRWVAAHGYHLASSVRAVHLRGPLQRLEYADWITEFQHPLSDA
jgi:DNA-binding transcriptional MerR regulator